jgi:hypothetical protein
MPKLEFEAGGHYFISKLKSVQGVIFGGPSKSPRFARERGNVTPGPGTYPLQLGIGDRSNFSLSTIRTPAVRTFYHSDRKIFMINRDARCKLHILFYHLQSHLAQATIRHPLSSASIVTSTHITQNPLMQRETPLQTKIIMTDSIFSPLRLRDHE